MDYYLANHPTIHVELNDDNTASLIKECRDATFHLTQIEYWHPGSVGDVNQLNSTGNFFKFPGEQAYNVINHLKTHGGISTIVPVKEMQPGQPRLGVRIFTNSAEVMLAVQFGIAPHWIEIYAPEQLILSYKPVPIDRIVGQLSMLDDAP